MPTERMEEVEVVCAYCDGLGTMFGGHLCSVCEGSAHTFETVVPNSLTAARLRLADAAEAKEKAEDEYGSSDGFLDAPIPGGPLDRAYREYTAALAALRTARGEG